MKTKLTKSLSCRTVILSMMLAGGLLFNASVQAAEKAGAQLKIPASSAEIWQAIDQEVEQLAVLIQAGKFEGVHHHAFAIRDLVAALPARSGSMSADKLARVKSNGKFVATLAERLDTAGDARDKEETESNFRKLKSILAAIRTSYPDLITK